MRVQTPAGDILSVEDWRTLAPPKSDRQWVEGRSAYELANAWCGSGRPVLPAEVRLILDLLPHGHRLTVQTVHPERQIRIDRRAGEPRNADLAFIAASGEHRLAVTVEAKADEPFGGTVTQTMVAALERTVRKASSDGLGRIRDLARALFRAPEAKRTLATIGSLHYQLLTATAGTLAYAQDEGADAAMLLVHEFRTNRTESSLHDRNNAALARFIARLSAQHLSQEISAPFVLGPLHVGPEDGPWRHIPLYIAKASVDRR